MQIKNFVPGQRGAPAAILPHGDALADELCEPCNLRALEATDEWAWCRITFESARVRDAAAAAAAGVAAIEAKVTSSRGAGAAIGWSSVPSHLDHQTPRPDFSRQTLTLCDLAGPVPLHATPDPDLERKPGADAGAVQEHQERSSQ